MGDDNFQIRKDDRSKASRPRYKKRFLKIKSGHASASPEPPQSVIDVADSSDVSDSSYRRPTNSNWSRYDETEFIQTEQMTAADFEFLEKHPTGSGAHFAFSSEKNWESDIDSEKTLNISYFNLNLPILNAGLKTIPFYKRLDYGDLPFTKNKIKQMDKQAEKAEAEYKNVLNNLEQDLVNRMLNIIAPAKSAKAKTSQSTTPETAPIFVEQINDNDEELDKLLSITEDDLSKTQISEPKEEITEIGVVEEKGEGEPVESGNKEDIQQWLDSILDD